MNKQEFMRQLRKSLQGLPQKDIEERLTFYGEMIEDRKEEGLSEEEAVAAVGSVEEIVAQILADTPPSKNITKKAKPKRPLKAWEIVLLALGSPIWLSLGIAAVAVILSFYISIWAVIISLWAVFGAFIGCAVAGIVSGIVFICISKVLIGIAMLAAGSVCAGLSIFTFYGCKAATKGILTLTKKMAVWIKNCFVREEELQ